MGTKGNVTPLRFKMEKEDGSFKVVKIDKIIDRAKEKLDGNNMIVFSCQTLIGNIEKNLKSNMNYILVNGCYLRFRIVIVDLRDN